MLVIDLQRIIISYVCLCRCEQQGCGGLLRPHVVWFGESLDPDILTRVDQELEKCDLCLVVSVYTDDVTGTCGSYTLLSL